ncbi:biopolymer transporter ExbD [Vibrio sp. SCSIO 43136]|uniref:ExbD/TolR family protein n=1 Tax=Vibrio sp. SCSIO 43136 TaxID=2819101 RepID=UPI002075688C|nr:biopolymer transporter ExbD [Vibrio sp. SCSIO 43136]USD66798.1 biopolymer transporter ExbD [Vibrio sp. SCSIO 43136]
MIRTVRHQQQTSVLPDLTPLLDIIFIVMVFLLLTASIKLESLEVSLPTADSSTSEITEKKTLTINILHQSPHWAINTNQYIDWDNFEIALLEQVKQQPEATVIIAADKQAEIQHMVKLLAFLQENNINATQLLTDNN